MWLIGYKAYGKKNDQAHTLENNLENEFNSFGVDGVAAFGYAYGDSGNGALVVNYDEP